MVVEGLDGCCARGGGYSGAAAAKSKAKKIGVGGVRFDGLLFHSRVICCSRQVVEPVWVSAMQILSSAFSHQPSRKVLRHVCRMKNLGRGRSATIARS